MAGVDKLNERILEDANVRAQENIESAEKEAKDILNEAQAEANEKKDRILRESKEEAQNVKKRMLAVAQLEARKSRLQAKQEMVEEAFLATLNKINLLPDSEYQKILEEMIVKSIKTGNEYIIISDKDKKRMNKDFISNINGKLKALNISGNVVLSKESSDINGGFILKDGNIEMNNSFETIIRMSRDSIESEVVKVLF